MSISLTHSPADVVRWLMVDLSLGTDPEASGTGNDWPIHASNEPDAPDSLITVYDTGGNTDGRMQRTGETAEHRGVMVQVRGTDQPTTWIKAEAIKTALDESVHNQLITIDSSVYIVYSITRRSGPVSLGREPSTNRFLFTINAVVALRQIT